LGPEEAPETSSIVVEERVDKQKIVPGVFELVVETSKEEVDLLLNKIETLKRPFSMNILK